MNKFWPKDLDIDDCDGPLEIIQEVRKEWEDSSKGSFTVDVRESESVNGNNLILLTARHVASNRTAELCTILHRPEFPYPAKIETNESDLPDTLKKSYYKPGVADVMGGIASMGRGEAVENDFVAESPAELRDLLSKALNLWSVKAAILSILWSRKVIGPGERRKDG